MAKDPPTPARRAETITPLWFGLVAIHRQPSGKRRVRVRWIRLLFSLLGLSAAFWLMASLGLYFFFKLERGFQDEQYLDVLLLPFHYKEHDHKMGEYFLRMGDVHYQNGRMDQAMNAYRLGVTKVPESLHGREMLSDFYYIYYRDQMEHSLRVLEDGVPYAIEADPAKAVPPEPTGQKYINDYLLALQKAHYPDKVIEVCQLYLGQKIANPHIRDLFALNLASVYVDKGDFDKAQKTLDDYKLGQTLDGILLTSRLLWESGRLYEATAFLEKANQRYPNNDYIFSMLSRFYRDLGDIDKAREYIGDREMLKPSDVSPRIELLYILAKTGDKKNADRSIQTILDQFSNDPSAMLALANFATDQGNVDLNLKLYGMAVASKDPNFNPANFALLVTEAYLTNDDYPGTLNFLDEIAAQKPAWFSANRTVFDSLRAVADFGLGHSDETEMYLAALLNSENMRPDTLMTLANRFLSHGALDDADRILRTAHRLDPNNQAILAQLISADLQTGNSAQMNENIQSLLRTRRPPLELLYDAYRQLGSDRFIFVPNREQLLIQIDSYIRGAIKTRQAESQT